MNPTRETGPCPGPVTHHSTTGSPKIANPPKPGKGFWALACMGKVRPIYREPEVSWYR